MCSRMRTSKVNVFWGNCIGEKEPESDSGLRALSKISSICTPKARQSLWFLFLPLCKRREWRHMSTYKINLIWLWDCKIIYVFQINKSRCEEVNLPRLHKKVRLELWFKLSLDSKSFLLMSFTDDWGSYDRWVGGRKVWQGEQEVLKSNMHRKKMI
jgi:hypothetical protein